MNCPYLSYFCGMQASLFKDYGDYLAYAIDNLRFPEQPKDLYEAVTYIFSLGGKRLRPALCLFSAEAFGSDKSAALPAALCVETFHNFSLIHDDIMDAAQLRRKAPTVHEKWNTNTGILSGDLALIIAYRFLENYRDERFFKLYNRFNQTAIEVCEGQQMDMLFEQRKKVSVDEYLQMISYKTAVLLGCSLAMGAIVAGAEDSQVQHCYDIGLTIGEAFQLRDDYLDTFGNQE
ncbi:MAG: polyprenyl synthetase family protein, partial [Flavobacteriaceae bacterium]|nr:polyprenyl synthetase family protein [Flavobacteriaceae bacterium]